MPCRDPWDDMGRTVYVDRPETVQKLCSALAKLEQYGVKVPDNCVLWWEAHKKEDLARIEAEKARLSKEKKRKAILSKLSEEERKLLGL